MTGSQTLISFALNQFQAPSDTIIQVNGALGSACLKLSNYRPGTFFHGEPNWSWVEYPNEERDAAFVRQAEYFRDEILGKQTLLCGLAEGIQTMKVNRAALKSAETRQEITIE